ncbi:IclR family transcriptional regulator [Thalassobacillus pellis]|uniref:IclR family transcriptional regulator n=1 Tax=Thalassobacillus pellis TaxID=748008 RepID=UPI0019610433|nr:IclR family transcriptional regulator [Thalassobacillus pellis]MBM7551469.1 DNA-binding IclR family transcriptional regulator [Thalassobacillus pellis]
MIQSVDRALTILNFLKEHPKGLGVTEIANRLDVAKSTVHRLLATMEKHGYVKQVEETSVYRLGLKFIEMHHSVVDNLNVVEEARPILEYLTEETGKITHLVALDAFEVLYIDKVEKPATIRIYSQLGRRAPLHCTGVGKALAAYFGEEERRTYFQKKPLTMFTENTFTDADNLTEEFRQIRSRGYALDNEEHEPGVRCIAVPIWDHQEKPVYAISITGTAGQMTDEAVNEYIPVVKHAARDISKLLGKL